MIVAHIVYMLAVCTYLPHKVAAAPRRRPDAFGGMAAAGGGNDGGDDRRPYKRKEPPSTVEVDDDDDEDDDDDMDDVDYYNEDAMWTSNQEAARHRPRWRDTRLGCTRFIISYAMLLIS